MIRGTMAEGGKTENVCVFEISHALSSEEDEIYDTAEEKSEKQSIKKTNH